MRAGSIALLNGERQFTRLIFLKKYCIIYIEKNKKDKKETPIMYDMNTILAAMAEGKTADDLAKEFADALNAANAKIKADRIAAEKAAAEAKANDAKIAAFKGIMIDIVDFVNTFYADQLPSDVVAAINNDIKDETVADTLKEIDSIVKMLPMFLALIKMEEEPASKKNKFFKSNMPSFKIGHNPKLTIKNIGDEDANKIIHDFLSGLI
jgi:hypothetical protein